MIQLQNITLDLGIAKIFEDVNCVFQAGDKVGVIGRNGAGKSTLLKVIAGVIKPTEGRISIEKGARIAYLPQEEILASTLNVFDEAFSAFADISEIHKKIQHIEELITRQECTPELLDDYSDLQLKAQEFDQPAAVKETNAVLTGLGFTPNMIEKSVSELSTGWKMRLALAKLLLTDADMFLFDEPTNHLDIVTQQWFLRKLHSMRQGFLLVSHDRMYLEKACTTIFEIERGRGKYYRGNLQAYLQEKKNQQDIACSTRARQEREIAQKQATIEQFRAGTRARQAQALIKQVERITLVEVEPPLPVVNFQFLVPQRPGAVILTFNNIAYGFNEKELFNSVSGEIQRGERVALVAANGVGKTTLLNCFMGTYKPTAGTIQFGHNVQQAFFEQNQADVLNPKKTILQEVSDACPLQKESEIRKMLGSFLFSGDDVHKKIDVLSGGEKNRVAMTKMLLKNANFFILDEPTNHLDLYIKDILCQALLAYQGTILFVSHDAHFVNRLATRIVELTPTGARSYLGTYEEFCAAQRMQLSQERTSTSTTPLKKTSPCGESADKIAMRKKVVDLERAINKYEHDERRIQDKLSAATYGTEEYNKAVARLLEIKKSLEIAQTDWESALTFIQAD
ncbi:MAG: ABC-F family ATP-binding cassette domain-containing protein [Candidatus Babeliaceae bacterium]|jgi:ATP-binding cassette subfamily F protein 3